MNKSNESPLFVGRTVEGVLFVLLVATTAHLLYSHLGFNPSDEGYMLAGSRRLLDGQVPHRDYISLRPVGTHLLHAPLLLWGGDRLIWWSRGIAWLQLATIAWLWTRIVERCFQPSPTRWMRWAAAFLAFTLSAHVFPVMPWNTIDGLFFFTLGIAICLLAGERWRWMGFLLLGGGSLFRQNFALAVPLLVWALGEWRNWRAWLWVVAPGTAYGLVLLLVGAWDEALVQMTSHRSSLAAAVLPSRLGLSLPSFGTGVVLGGSGLSFALLGSDRWTKRCGVAALLGSVGLALGSLLMMSRAHGWLLFGSVLGMIPLLATTHRDRLRGALLALIVAWSVSVSEGWPSPALASGSLVLVLLATTRAACGDPFFRGATRLVLGTCVVVLVAALGFHRGRTQRIYYERPAHELQHSLTDILPGARGIRTNENTWRFLNDMRHVTAWVRQQRGENTPLAVLPEVAQYWVRSQQPNPLSTDWPIDPELNHPDTRSRVQTEIERGRGRVVFLVQKHHAIHLSNRLTPYREGECATRDLVRRTFRRIHETEFFEVYE